jgi:hypothetical protein
MKKKLIQLLAKFNVTASEAATEDELFAQLEQALRTQVVRIDGNNPALYIARRCAEHMLENVSPNDLPEEVQKIRDTVAQLRAVEQIERLEVQAKAERHKRVIAELDSIIAKRPWLNREDYLARCVADDTWLNTLRSTPELPEFCAWNAETKTVEVKS